MIIYQTSRGYRMRNPEWRSNGFLVLDHPGEYSREIMNSNMRRAYKRMRKTMSAYDARQVFVDIVFNCNIGDLAFTFRKDNNEDHD